MRRAVVTLLLASAGAHAEQPAEADFDDLSNIVILHERVDRSEPFTVRDQNPLLAGLGIPGAMPTRIPYGWSMSTDVYWGSSALIQQTGTETLVVDAETHEARFSVQGAISDRIGWQLQLPYRYTGGGNLDGFIDSWHDWFGLQEGARSELPSDQINIRYTRGGIGQFARNSSASGVGDVQAALGYELHDSPGSALTAWLGVKLPTGDADKLTGSGATDVSLSLSGRRRLSDRWSAFGQAAVTYLGEGGFLADRQRNVLWSGMAGLNVRTWRGLSLKAQIDAHTAAYDSDLDFFSEAVVLTVGGDYLFASGWRLDLGVSEDIAVEHSPDVVFLAGIKRGW